jgi:hypothetical protein
LILEFKPLGVWENELLLFKIVVYHYGSCIQGNDRERRVYIFLVGNLC